MYGVYPQLIHHQRFKNNTSIFVGMAEAQPQTTSLISLPLELQIEIRNHLAWWDAYNLRHSCLRFYSIIPSKTLTLAGLMNEAMISKEFRTSFFLASSRLFMCTSCKRLYRTSQYQEWGACFRSVSLVATICLRCDGRYERSATRRR